MSTLSPGLHLIQQHRDIDHGIHQLAEGADDVAALAHALSLLRHHIYVEESIVFPAVAKVGLTMPVFVMQQEHGQMWPLIERLSAGCAANHPAAALRDDAKMLFQLLQIHNEKEELVVYTSADRLAAEQPALHLAQVMLEAELPEAWRCIKASHSTSSAAQP